MINTDEQSESMADLQASLLRLNKIGISSTPTATLESMLQNLESDMKDLATQASELEAEAQEKLQQGDLGIYKRVRERSRLLASEMGELEGLRDRVVDAIEYNYMTERLSKVLGGMWAVNALQIFMMLLIFFVLGLLAYDSLAPTKWGYFVLGDDHQYLVSDYVNQESAWQDVVERFGIQDAKYERFEEHQRPVWLESQSIFLIDIGCCVLFMLEFLVRLYCSRSKRWYWRNYWIDFVTSIPIPGEAQLSRFGRIARIGRFARLLRFSSVLRVMRVFLMLWRGMDKLQDAMDVKLMKRSLKWGLVVMVLGGIAVYYAESALVESDNDVKTLGGGMWWSFTTVCTGGFGDIHNPITIVGRILTVVLIITGMILVGVFTATLTSLYVGEESEELQRYQEDMNARLDRSEVIISGYSNPTRDGPDAEA
ncbi:MAG: ion transporter [Pirellulales bacterium]|nr:ion transporter [Pirellulales bacterium]